MTPPGSEGCSNHAERYPVERFTQSACRDQGAETGAGQAERDSDLQEHPGVDVDNIRISDIVLSIKGLGHSLELNNLFGHGTLANISGYKDFINGIVSIYTGKLTDAMSSSKFDKAVEPEAAAKADVDKKKIQQGLELVKGYFA